MQVVAPFRVPTPFREGRLKRLVEAPLTRALAVDRLNGVYAAATGPGGPGPFIDRALRAVGVGWRLDEADRARIPARGPAVVVANHPHGLLDGLVIGTALRSIRPDVKVLANHLLKDVPELRELLIFVDPFGADPTANMAAVKQALAWLRDGGLLAVFPAGEVSSLDLRRGTVADPAWSAVPARLARRVKAPVVPLFFEGGNSPLFQLAGLVHPRLRTALLPRELLWKRRATVVLRTGRAIAPEQLDGFASDAEATEYLRARTYLLAERSPARANPRPPSTAPRQEQLALPEEPAALAAEVAALPPDALLLASGDHEVWHVRAAQAPTVLRELGRLREVAFRAAGEGTGRARDLDRFDLDYIHLFVWSRSRRAIVGAYRLGPSDELARRHAGPGGLYTRTLFAYDARLLEALGPALELGRSFVRPEDQRAHAPLALLWRGIGRFVARHPRYRRLFGAVSVSAAYAPLSRRLIVAHLESRRDAELGRLVRPLRPPESGPLPLPPAALKDAAEVSALVSELEPDGRGLPVLVKQYLRLGARVLGCSVDPGFGDVVDGLVVVDLATVERRVLERTIGKEETAAVLGPRPATTVAEPLDLEVEERTSA